MTTEQPTVGILSTSALDLDEAHHKSAERELAEDADAEPTESLWDLGKRTLAMVLLWLGLAATCAMLFFRVNGILAADPVHNTHVFSHKTDFISLGIVALAALPALLTYIGRLAAARAVRQTVNLADPEGMKPGMLSSRVDIPAALKLVPAVQARAALRIWLSEQRQLRFRTERFELQAHLFGVIASLLLAVCAALAAVAVRAVPPPGPQLMLCVVPCAVIAAVVVSFGRDFGRMLSRVARRDISASMMAMASRNLLIVIVAACILRSLVAIAPGADETHPFIWSILAGALAAMLGDSAIDAIKERLALVFGVKLPDKNRAVPTTAIDGLSEEDIARLQEEGIDSVHALAFASTARLYFHTPYPLSRICEWQDQALLIERLGVDRARQWKAEFGIPGIVAAQEWAWKYLALESDEDRQKMFQQLGLPSRVNADAVFSRLAEEALAVRLATYKLAAPAPALVKPAASAKTKSPERKA